MKNHAESSGRYSKRRHMLQVTASNHPGPAMPNGASVTCGLMAYRPQPEFWDLAKSRPEHFCPGRASPPSCPKPARPQASGLGFDPGRNARVESWAWNMGSSSFQPCPRPARPRQKCPGRAEICRGLILPDPGRVSRIPTWCGLELFPIPISLLTNLPPATLHYAARG